MKDTILIETSSSEELEAFARNFSNSARCLAMIETDNPKIFHCNEYHDLSIALSFGSWLHEDMYECPVIRVGITDKCFYADYINSDGKIMFTVHFFEKLYHMKKVDGFMEDYVDYYFCGGRDFGYAFKDGKISKKMFSRCYKPFSSTAKNILGIV